MVSNLQNIGKRIDNLKKVILKENPKDLWIIEQIHPLFIQLVDSNISKEQENHIISLLENILDKYLWRFNSTFEHKNLTSYLLEGLLPEEEKKQTTALYAGGFKPPTSGHFEVVKTALEQNPEIDELIIFVGAKERDGISQDESMLIWDIYKQYLPLKVKIEPSSKPPIKAVYNFAKEHPTREILWVIGAREGNEEDFKDITSRTKSMTNYPNIELRTIVTKGGVSGTAARNASKISLEKFEKFIPDQLTDEEKQQVYELVSGKIQEVLNEDGKLYLDIPKFNHKKTFSENLWYTLNEISLSKENAVNTDGDLTGGTFTVGNITYEYSIKNIPNPYKDGGLFYNVQFTPKGEMTSIPQMGKENYIKILSTMYKIIVDFIEKEKPEYMGISSLDNNGGKNYHKVYANLTDNKSNNIPGYFRKDVNLEFTTPEGKGRFIVLKRKRTLNEDASYSNHIDYKQKIKELTQHMIDKGMNILPLPKVRFIHSDSSNAKDFFGKTAYYDPNNQEIVLYTEGRHPKDIVRSFSHEMIHHIQNLEDRLGDIQTTNTQEDDSLNDIEAEANLKGTMTFRNWTDSLNESKTKDPFGINAYAMELGRLREDEEQPWKIYLDMDGVLADFDQRFKDLSGMAPREFEDKYGKNAFWDFIDEGDNKIKFWAGIPVMDGAKQLVDFAKDYDYELLTAPSLKKQSLIGKTVWVKKYTGDIFPTKPKINFKAAKNKHLIKPELTKYDILVDDRASTIDNWNNAGGTGILYKSAGQAINDLKKIVL